MELKEFIKTALTDITDAVSELQGELRNRAIVSPSVPNPISNVTVKDPQNDKINRPISKIDFDVAITVGGRRKSRNTDILSQIGRQQREPHRECFKDNVLNPCGFAYLSC